VHDVVNVPMHNPGPMPDKPDLVHVEIFGQSYAVKAGGDPAYVETLAASVDKQMKDVSRASGAVDGYHALEALCVARDGYGNLEPTFLMRGSDSPRGEHASASRKPEARLRAPTW
jgi:hypothetical protein